MAGATVGRRDARVTSCVPCPRSSEGLIPKPGVALHSSGLPIRNSRRSLLDPAHTVWMPRISEFFGIVIWMYYDDHPPPHFHAEYAGSWASIEIESLVVSRGGIPPAQLSKVREWA